ncbi:MAG: hypothetical protein VW879_04315, partial [Opitutae bacterium]
MAKTIAMPTIKPTVRATTQDDLDYERLFDQMHQVNSNDMPVGLIRGIPMPKNFTDPARPKREPTVVKPPTPAPTQQFAGTAEQERTPSITTKKATPWRIPIPDFKAAPKAVSLPTPTPAQQFAGTAEQEKALK